MNFVTLIDFVLIKPRLVWTMDIRYVICVLHQKQKCQVLAITYLAFLQSGSTTILKYFTGDLVSRVLKVHDGIRDLDSDGIYNGLDIKRPSQSVSQLPQIICKNRRNLQLS